MGFLQTFVRLAHECQRYRPFFHDATGHDPVLGRYLAPADVVDALTLPSRTPKTGRLKLLDALARCHNAAPSALWQGSAHSEDRADRGAFELRATPRRLERASRPWRRRRRRLWRGPYVLLTP